MRVLPPPDTLEGHDYFVIVYDPDIETYILHTIDGRSFDLGDAERSLLFFRLSNMEEIGERAIDCSFNFRAVQCIPCQKRVFPIEIEIDENTNPTLGELLSHPTAITVPYLG